MTKTKLQIMREKKGMTVCSIECDKCSDGEIVNTGDMGTRTVEDIKKYWRSEGWRIGKVTLCPTCHHKKEV